MSVNSKILEANFGLNVQELQEFDSVFLHNPTSEDFTYKFDGKPYTIKAGEIRGFSKFVSFHLAKHLSTKIVVDEAMSKMTKKQKEDRNDPAHGRIAQLANYDTHERRIALFNILGNEELVTQVCAIYPFKGFVGEMGTYQSYVEEAKRAKDKDVEKDK